MYVYLCLLLNNILTNCHLLSVAARKIVPSSTEFEIQSSESVDSKICRANENWKTVYKYTICKYVNGLINNK